MALEIHKQALVGAFMLVALNTLRNAKSLEDAGIEKISLDIFKELVKTTLTPTQTDVQKDMYQRFTELEPNTPLSDKDKADVQIVLASLSFHLS